MVEKIPVPRTAIHRIEADGVTVFYREAGPADAPTVLLLHGFPTSSFQCRELIPRLADRYRVIAPDLPGFGFTEISEKRNYKYTFDALANTILARVAPTFPRLDSQRFQFPRGPRPRKLGSRRQTTSPSIDCPAEAVLGCLENVLVRVDLSSWSLLEPS